MSKNHSIRSIIPQKIPERLLISKDYSNIILYALEIFGPMYHQEFVNRGTITNKISEKTFYNHIKQLKKRGYIESEIDENTRRRMYNITTEGEKVLKENLRNNQEVYGDILSKIENVKYFEKKKVFDGQFGRILDSLKKFEEKFLRNIVDLSHFYPEDKFQNYKELELKLKNEKRLKEEILKNYTQFIEHLKDYKKVIESDILESESEIFYGEEEEDYDFHCPECNGNKIIDYGKLFECRMCGLEFNKVSFKLINDKDSILSNEGKTGFLDAFKDSSDEDESNNI